MRDVAVIGIGMTSFGELWETSLRSLWAEAALAALDDAGVSSVDLITIGCMSSGLFTGQEHLASLLSDELGNGRGSRHAGRVRLCVGRAGGPRRIRRGRIRPLRHRPRHRRREDDRCRRRRRHLRPRHRRRFGVGGLPRRHLPRPLRHVGPGPHGEIRHHSRATRPGGGQEPRQRPAQSPRPVPPQDHRRGRVELNRWWPTRSTCSTVRR